MKFLYCSDCGDFVKMRLRKKSRCRCKKVEGFYVDFENVVYSGENAVCIGVDNKSFDDALDNRPLDGRGAFFDAYVIPYYCDSTIYTEDISGYYDLEKFSNKYRYTAGGFLQEKWTDKITRIRKKNIFLRIIYHIFKKYMFPSLPDINVKEIIKDA